MAVAAVMSLVLVSLVVSMLLCPLPYVWRMCSYRLLVAVAVVVSAALASAAAAAAALVRGPRPLLCGRVLRVGHPERACVHAVVAAVGAALALAL